MDYPGYYKLALQQSYGGEFPEMASEEFDRRCPLKQVPAALKALYLALGSRRICLMHSLLFPPEQLAFDGDYLPLVNDETCRRAIAREALGEENPCIFRFDAGKYVPDGETRLALLFANLIQDSATGAHAWMEISGRGWWNCIRNHTATSRRTLRLISIAAILFFLVGFFTRLGAELYRYCRPAAFLFIGLMGAVPGWLYLTLLRNVKYWRVWLNWTDNVRTVREDDEVVAVIRNLSLCFLIWNQPELWSEGTEGRVSFCPGLALCEGKRRFCQMRYDFLPATDGRLTFPGFPAISYTGGKPVSILLRGELDDSGCLGFVFVKEGMANRLPPPDNSILF